MCAVLWGECLKYHFAISVPFWETIFLCLFSACKINNFVYCDSVTDNIALN